MHRIIKPILLMLIFLVSCTPEDNTDRLKYDSKYKFPIVEAQKEISKLLMIDQVPGTSIAVSYEGELIWSQAIGLASRELEVPASRNTLFRIGNASELLAAYLLVVLQQDSVIDLENSFYEYVPGFPKKETDFSVEMLGAHAAGFPGSSLDEILYHSRDKSMADFVKSFDDRKLIFQPGENFYRSDYNSILMAMVAESQMKKPFHALVKEYLLDSLGIHNTMVDDPRIITPKRSDTYTSDYLARLVNAPEINPWPVLPSHGWLATAEDLNKLANEMLYPKLFNEKSLNKFREKYTLKNGNKSNFSFGWLVGQDRKNRNFMASIGNTIGGASAVVVYPEDKLVVTMCSNRGNENTELPVLIIADIFLEYFSENTVF